MAFEIIFNQLGLIFNAIEKIFIFENSQKLNKLSSHLVTLDLSLVIRYSKSRFPRQLRRHLERLVQASNYFLRFLDRFGIRFQQGQKLYPWSSLVSPSQQLSKSST